MQSNVSEMTIQEISFWKKSYKEYMEGFQDITAGEACRGYVEVVKELNARFADVEEIVTEKDKKEFVKLFGEYLRIENILQNYDEFTCLKALPKVDFNDQEAVKEFKDAYFVSDEDIKSYANDRCIGRKNDSRLSFCIQ